MTEINYRWAPEEIATLQRLAMRGDLFYSEIAEKLGRSAASVRWKAKKLNLPSTRDSNARHRIGSWNAKHRHLREAVFEYFLTHTKEQTRKAFGLSDSEIKSLFTVGYRDPSLKHLRKETREHSPWSASQLTLLLRYSGFRPRKWIAEKIGRGNEKSCIKERLNKLGIASRNLQGLTLSQFRQAFRKDPDFFIQTDAGPQGSFQRSTHWKIIPWVYLHQEIQAKRLRTTKELSILIATHALFQNWIFEGNALSKIQVIGEQIKKECIARGKS